MRPSHIIEQLEQQFTGLTPKPSWGETSLFYNPNKILPNGVYFCTLKEKNGDNDKASQLDREGVFRFSLGISKESYQQHFGPRPARPAKGSIIDTTHDFTTLNQLMPHPIYGWMSWVQVLNPSPETFMSLQPLIEESYNSAVRKFDKKVTKMEKV